MGGGALSRAGPSAFVSSHRWCHSHSAAPRAIAGLLLAVTGCGQQTADAPALSTHIDTVAGVMRVSNTGTAPERQLRPVLTVGSAGALGEPADDEFGRITSVGLSPSGDLFVADQLRSEIRAFGPDGQLKLVIGRRGQGPGEFLALYSLAWVGQTLLALDYGNGRIARIGADGSWLGQYAAPGRVSGPATMLRLYAVGPGEVYAWSLVAEPEGGRRTYVRYGPSGIESAIPQAVWPANDRSHIVCRRPGEISFFDIPYAPTFRQHPAPGNRIAVVWTAEYRIAFLSAEGDTVRIVERTHTPVPLSAVEWHAVSEAFRSFRDERPGASCEPRSPSKPDVKPPVKDLLFDVQGRMWVEVTSAGGDRWEIFDPEGALLFSLPAFRRSDDLAPFLGRRHLAYVTADSLGVQRVHVSQFGPPP